MGGLISIYVINLVSQSIYSTRIQYRHRQRERTTQKNAFLFISVPYPSVYFPSPFRSPSPSASIMIIMIFTPSHFPSPSLASLSTSLFLISSIRPIGNLGPPSIHHVFCVLTVATLFPTCCTIPFLFVPFQCWSKRQVVQ